MTSDDAVTLIVELFESRKPHAYEPFYRDTDDGEIRCFYCLACQDEGSSEEHHTSACFYAKAKRIYEMVKGSWPR